MSQLTVTMLLLVSMSLPGAAQRRPVTVGVPFAINTPEPETLELALDEVELDWSESGTIGRPIAAQPLAVNGAELIERGPTRAVFRVSGVTTPLALAAVTRNLESANPASEGNFVLYALNSGRESGSRRVLTTHVALVVENPTDASAILAELSATSPQGLEGVPTGFVLEASDPLSATQLADALRQRAGVKTAYALVKRHQVIR